MANQILELLSNKEKWNKISNNSLEEVKKYYSENVARKWIEILEK